MNENVAMNENEAILIRHARTEALLRQFARNVPRSLMVLVDGGERADAISYQSEDGYYITELNASLDVGPVILDALAERTPIS